MKITTFDGTCERQILTGMITETLVLGRIAQRWQEEPLLSAPWSNILGQLTIDYFHKHHKAPKKNIESLFRSWAEHHPNQESIELVERYLASLSGAYEQLRQELNPFFILDLADRHFNEVKAKKLIQSLQGDIDRGHISEALERIASFNRIHLGEQTAVDLVNDKEEVFAAFAEGLEPLLTYHGALGKLFQEDLARDCFIAFVAPEKVGKTNWLIDVAHTAICQQRRVAFFEVGDMSKIQTELRFLARWARHPFRSTNDDCSWPCDVRWPVSITHNGNPEDPADVVHEIRTFHNRLNATTAWEGCQRLINQRLRSRKSYFRLSVHPTKSINVAGIRSILTDWDTEDFVADVVLIDYADLLTSPKGSSKMDSRDQTNASWEQLRSLSQERHCLLVTASQTNAKSYTQNRPLDRSCFSEDKRKWAHVTAAFGLNMTAEEKKQGLMRLNCILRREGEFNHNRVCHVANCLPFAQAAVLSTW